MAGADKERGPHKVTSFDVARAAGVSRAAVSRAFTPDASVSAKTREKVYSAAKQLGYRVNYLARSLTNKRSDLVGLVAAGLDNPFRLMQIEHLSRALLARDLRPILLPTSPDSDTSEVIGQLLHYAVSGVIVTSDAPPTEICEQCAAEGVPIVLINKGDEIPFVDRVLTDDEAAAHLAAERLIAAGARSLAVAAAPSISFTARRRAEAFMARCRMRGITAVDLTIARNDYASGLLLARHLETAGIDGLFCVSDYLACGVVDGLMHGRRHPGQLPLRLVGHDDIPQASWLGYQLTTLLQPCALQAERVLDLLISRIGEPDLPGRVVTTPVTLIERSTA